MNLTGKPDSEVANALERLKTSTVPGLLAERAREEADSPAVRFKRGGIFRTLTWSAYHSEVRAAAACLVSLGVRPGDRLAIMGDACIGYLLVDVAAQFLGVIPSGVYPTSSAQELAYVLKLVGARVFVAEDQEHLDRLLEAEAHDPAMRVERIVVCDGRALFLYDDSRIELLDELLQRARSDASALAQADRFAAAVRADMPGSIIFTSGTTGHPKAAYRSQSADLIGFGHAFLEMLPELASRPHRVLSHLPLAHGMQRAMTIYLPLMSGIVPYIGEPNQSLLSLMNEVRPTHVMGVPRSWEKIAAYVQVGVETSGRAAQLMFSLASAVGQRRVRALWRTGGRFAGPFTELAYWTLWLLVLWPVRHKLGLTFASGGLSGGAPLPPRVHEAIQVLGIPFRDMFGMTETGGVGVQPGAWPPPEAPIRAISYCSVQIAADGELLLRTPACISGYWNDEAATAALYDAERYVRSGDVVTGAGSDFRIVDRKKDILITSGGKNIAPAMVENALRASPYISEVIVFGDNRKYISALVELDFENVAHWARQRQLPYTGLVSLAQNESVVSLIGAEIERLNVQLARVEQVKKFRILTKELIPEDGETTPTRKVKRAHAYKLFSALVEDMYAQN